MHYYILPDKEDYRIMKVQNEDHEIFQRRYKKQILFEGASIAEVLVKFSASIEEMGVLQSGKTYSPERDTGNAGGQPASDTVNGGDS